jgi:hypothetical protein
MPIVNLITKEKIAPEKKEVLKKEFANVMYHRKFRQSNRVNWFITFSVHSRRNCKR